MIEFNEAKTKTIILIIFLSHSAHREQSTLYVKTVDILFPILLIRLAKTDILKLSYD